MNKKKIIILSIVLVLVVAYVSRVAYINIVEGPINVEQYSIGDKVKLCNYQFQVDECQVLYLDEFEKKYGELYDKEYKENNYVFIIVKINYKMLTDKYNKKYDFSLADFKFQYKAIASDFDLDIFNYITSSDYHLVEKPGDCTTVYLPYAIAKPNITEEHWKNIKNLDFKLSINNAENKKIEVNLKK